VVVREAFLLDPVGSANSVLTAQLRSAPSFVGVSPRRRPGAGIVRASVERSRQPPRILHGKRVFLAQLVEDADHQPADPLTLLGLGPFHLLEQEGESAFAIAALRAPTTSGQTPSPRSSSISSSASAAAAPNEHSPASAGKQLGEYLVVLKVSRCET
jgi:hypothetical protein